MNSMIEDINHLSREIGARPAGTEEERLAAMYIAENIQKRSGLPFDIEDFEGAKGKDRVFNGLSLISVILLFVAVLLTVTTIPAFILTLVIAVLLVLEFMDKPLLSNFFRYGISQNVVAKYVPAYSSQKQQVQRKRKVVLVAHYDSGRSLPKNDSSIYKFQAYMKVVALVAVCVIPLFLLIKMFVFPETTGGLTLFCIIFALIIALIIICPTFLDFYKSRLLYNEGANCNASSNAALIEIARQLGTGSYSTDEDFQSSEIEEKPVIHGEEAAKEANLIPEGAEVEYKAQDSQKTAEPEIEVIEEKKPEDPLEEKEQSLASAKAAIAAFTSPRKPRPKYDEEGNAISKSGKIQKLEVDAAEKPDAEANVEVEQLAIKPDTTSSIPAYKMEDKSTGQVPDWFKSAQNKAKKDDDSNDSEGSTKRSRFAHTMDVMAAKQEDELRRKKEEEEKKRAKLREQIAAANKAAEEERQKKFAEKEKPFVKSEEPEKPETTEEEKPVEKAEAEKPVEKVEEKVEPKEETSKDDRKAWDEISQQQEALSLDESFKLHQKEKSRKIESTLKMNKADLKPFEPKPVDLEAETKIQTEAPKEQVNNHKPPVQEIQNNADKEGLKVDIPEIPEIDQAKPEEKHEPTLLPENSGPIKLDEMKQYAPLDDQSFISGNAMPENKALSDIPEVYTNEENVEKKASETNNLKPKDKKEDNLAEDDVEKGKFGTGSFAAVSESAGIAGATGTFAPVKDELIDDASKSGEIQSKDDMVVADADDSVYTEGEFTDTGAFAGKGYVDMPEEKRGGFFSRFGRKKKKKSGKHSTKDDFIEVTGNTGLEDDVIDTEEDWEGGAFSNISGSVKKLPFNKLRKNESSDSTADQESENIEDEGDLSYASAESPITSMVDAVPEFEEQIQDFHNASINMEVWMVALGAEIDENSGIKAFLTEHASELRGAIIVDLEGLGAGELSLINSEGIVRKSSTNSRFKRYIRQAANKLNVVVPSIDLPWSESSAAYANRAGFKTIRLVGMDGNKPAYYMQNDDVAENVEEDTLKNNVKYLLELIQCI